MLRMARRSLAISVFILCFLRMAEPLFYTCHFIKMCARCQIRWGRFLSVLDKYVILNTLFHWRQKMSTDVERCDV